MRCSHTLSIQALCCGACLRIAADTQLSGCEKATWGLMLMMVLPFVQYTRMMQKMNFDCAIKAFTIQNMVASCSTGFPIRLEGLAAHFDMFVHYEPEVFPGLVFRMADPKVVLLIFVTGKVVITGAKKVEDIYKAFESIYDVLQDHRKGDARHIVRADTAATGAIEDIANNQVCTCTVLGTTRALSCTSLPW